MINAYVMHAIMSAQGFTEGHVYQKVPGFAFGSGQRVNQHQCSRGTTLSILNISSI
jgi:hypothetical protein